jgi:hypothetical protein
MIQTQEASCTNCAHLEVCKFTQEIEDIKKRTKAITHSNPIKIVVMCVEYKQTSGVLRETLPTLVYEPPPPVQKKNIKALTVSILNNINSRKKLSL